MKNADLQIVLASSSPRRRDLLKTLGVHFQVVIPDIEEKPRDGEAPEAYVKRNSMEKSSAVASGLDSNQLGTCLVVAADTVVVLGSDILEKPLNHDHAFDMLSSLSGKEHQVYSGVTLSYFCKSEGWKERTFSVCTSVRIKNLQAEEIRSYIQSGEPLDKAGSYAAQGLGSYMVESIHGSYANVVGLPVAQVLQELESAFGLTLWDLRS